MKNSEDMQVGVVIERRKTNHPWQEYSWRPVEVVPGLRQTGDWRLLYEDENRARFIAGTLTIELFPRETEGYRRNLSQRVPAVFVMLRRNEDAGSDRPELFHATVCPYEAQEYLDAGEDIIEAVPMPPVVADWVRAFVAVHHQDVPFVKRKRKRHTQEGDAPTLAQSRGRKP